MLDRWTYFSKRHNATCSTLRLLTMDFHIVEMVASYIVHYTWKRLMLLWREKYGCTVCGLSTILSEVFSFLLLSLIWMDSRDRIAHALNVVLFDFPAWWIHFLHHYQQDVVFLCLGRRWGWRHSKGCTTWHPWLEQVHSSRRSPKVSPWKWVHLPTSFILSLLKSARVIWKQILINGEWFQQGWRY